MGTYFSPMLNMHFSSKEQAEDFEKKAILDEQIRQNELIKEQNRLINNNVNNNVYNNSYDYSSNDISVLGLLSILSIIPIALGFVMTFLTMGDGTEQGIKVLLAGLVCPILQGLIHLIKITKQSIHDKKLKKEKEQIRKARIERKLNKN